MISWITFAWQIELIALGIFGYGLFIFSRLATRLEKIFITPLIYILSSLIINVLLGIMIGFFVTSQIAYSSPLWVIHPILGLLAAVLFVMGGRRFFGALKASKK
jgi:F0F1-type ATP synthase assembly protein I